MAAKRTKAITLGQENFSTLDVPHQDQTSLEHSSSSRSLLHASTYVSEQKVTENVECLVKDFELNEAKTLKKLEKSSRKSHFTVRQNMESTTIEFSAAAYLSFKDLLKTISFKIEGEYLLQSGKVKTPKVKP
jgi:hypothetical protein